MKALLRLYYGSIQVVYPPFLLRNTSGLQLVYGHGPADGVSSVLPAAGQVFACVGGLVSMCRWFS